MLVERSAAETIASHVRLTDLSLSLSLTHTYIYIHTQSQYHKVFFRCETTLTQTMMLDSEASTGVNENAAELQFDPEFSDIHILSNAQVAIILQASAQSAVNKDEELNEVYRKAQKYAERFNTMTNPEKEHQELVDELDNLQEYV